MATEINLSNFEEFLPALSNEEKAKAKTLFYKKLALKLHKFYGGKTMLMPKAALPDLDLFNLYYTPGVSSVSTSIRDDNKLSFELSSRGNSVAVISDSTRVLGDGDCTPAGGLGVMEGKALLMKYLGGVDASALCIDSRLPDGKPSADKIIDFVKMCAPSFGAINLEDISQPNCYKVLDTLRESLDIPVWHDDAQGTACVTVAGFLNALKVAGKEISKVKIVFYGAGAANTTIADFIIKAGANPANIIMFDVSCALSADRADLKDNPDFYKQWQLCRQTNPSKTKKEEDAFKNADALIALSKQGPDTIKPEWIKLMAARPIVFTCANPVPEIYPQEAKAAGAFITATGRGDFENQINNSLCFPGILKGVLLCRAKKITDNMALAAARAIAARAEQIAPLSPVNIIPKMDDIEVFALQAAAVAKAAKEEGLARIDISEEDVYNKTKADIIAVRKAAKVLEDCGLIKQPPQTLVQEAFAEVLQQCVK